MQSVKTRTQDIISARPNWSQPVTETHEFRTVISTSRDGTEQRAALRQTPRMAVDFHADAVGDRARRSAADALRFPAGSTFHLPIRWRNVRLDGVHGAGASELLFAGDTPWWLVGGVQVYLENDTSEEVIDVLSVTPGAITLSGATSGDYADGVKVSLAYVARFPKKHTAQSSVAAHRSGSLAFEVDPASGPDVVPQHTIDGHHEGYPVLLTSPDWRSGLRSEVDDLREVLDHGQGRIDVQPHPADRDVRETLAFLELTRESVDALAGFFYRQRGQQRPFWLPSHLSDMDLAADALTGTTTLVLLGEDLALYEDSRVYRTIFARWPDGAVQMNRVDGYAVDQDGDTVLTLREEWKRDVDVSVRLQWGLLCRFATDTLEVAWQSDTAAEISLPVRVLTCDWVDWPMEEVKSPLVDPVGGGVTQPWTDGSYTGFDVLLDLIPAAAVDANLVTAEAEIQMVFDPAYWDNHIASVNILDVKFLDEFEGQLTSPDGSSGNSNTVNHSQGDPYEVHTLSQEPFRTPAGCRHIRFRIYVSEKTQFSEVTSNCKVVSPSWGPETDKGVLL
ncbi:hypothetical protein [Shimia sp.]|uniref:hypothetical protein n=1 Tax=Shimia sp. TaxID=1954381 RepID=UPI00329A2E7C